MINRNTEILERVQAAALAAVDVLDNALATDAIRIDKKATVALNVLNQYVRLANAMTKAAGDETTDDEPETLHTAASPIFKLAQ